MERPEQRPAPGTRLVRHCGDSLLFELGVPSAPPGHAALRTNLGSARVRRAEIIRHVQRDEPVLGRDWHDMPMSRTAAGGFEVRVPLAEVGRFEAKAFFQPDGPGELLWPAGDNVVVKVEPADTCCGNMVYTAFVRLFGRTADAGGPFPLKELDAAGYTVIPPSGTFRDLARQLDFIIGTLGFRIIQLLPIHPTPTTYARMGRFGSPFATLDFRDVDPALAEFDRRTTPLEQFRELVDAVHAREAKLFMDLPINHTGWASHLQVEHPEWFARQEDRRFQSPGAWGVTWEDLSKLDYSDRRLWEYMADVFLFWCRREVDGFRCDAGYMVPAPVWEYIAARVRDEYPDTVFLLEGLGGSPEAADRLLAEANLDWAYSELFQNYTPEQAAACVRAGAEASMTRGLMVHFAETHDNPRLAARSAAYARMRTALSALCSCAGGFGITCGVEWFATERIAVHSISPLNWGSRENQVREIARLNALLASHPAFRAGARLRVLPAASAQGLAVLRADPAGRRPLLALVNLDERGPADFSWDAADFPAGGPLADLLSGREAAARRAGTTAFLSVPPAGAVCLAADRGELELLDGPGPGGPARRRGAGDADAQRLKAKAAQVLGLLSVPRRGEPADLDGEARELARDPLAWRPLGAPLAVPWRWPADLRRRVVVPPDCCLCVESPHRFAATLTRGSRTAAHERSMPGGAAGHFALFAPMRSLGGAGECALELTVFEPEGCRRGGAGLLCPEEPEEGGVRLSFEREEVARKDLYALCVNGLGGMAQVRGAWGEVRSQYDALLAANLHPRAPVDRHVMFTRCRAWLVCRKYSQPLGIACLDRFACPESNRVQWRFTVPVGQGKCARLDVELTMPRGRNGIRLRFARRKRDSAPDSLDNDVPVELILRPDVEDRVNHGRTRAGDGAWQSWPRSVAAARNGFQFGPSPDRRLHASLSPGVFVPEPEWTHGVFHPVEAQRGLEAKSDLFSPGYFSVSLLGGGEAVLEASVGPPPETAAPAAEPAPAGGGGQGGRVRLAEAMRRAIRQFIVQRNGSKTVIAGYPWFLDWGRDTLICLRGIVAAGLLDEARDILLQFARFERGGTLPNMIRGDDASDRDTSDAPLWFFVACGDLMRAEGSAALLAADCGGRTVLDALRSVALNVRRGTSNGIAADPESGLVFSPAHFTWMDTNHPAGTPREGYPVEVQALWHSALDLLARVDPGGGWGPQAERVRESLRSLYPRGDAGGRRYLSDCLHARPGAGAAGAVADDAVRPNQLLAVTLGAVRDPDLCAGILGACEALLVPGAIRSLADRPVTHALPVRQHGRLLNDPLRPYWGRYEGDEDTRRKPAYHNGTAWTWLFPSYAEALYMAYGEPARKPALDLLSGALEPIHSACVGHVPEIADGDAPHAPRGCGAQAWGATELYRVLAFLGGA